MDLWYLQWFVYSLVVMSVAGGCSASLWLSRAHEAVWDTSSKLAKSRQH